MKTERNRNHIQEWPRKRPKTTENDRKNGSFGCAAKNEFFDFSTKFHSNSSIFRENSVFFAKNSYICRCFNILRYGRKNRATHQASWKKQYKTMAMPLYPRHHHSNHHNMFSQRKYNKPNNADIRVIKKPYLVHLALLLCNALSCISSSLFLSWAEELPSIDQSEPTFSRLSYSCRYRTPLGVIRHMLKDSSM